MKSLQLSGILFSLCVIFFCPLDSFAQHYDLEGGLGEIPLDSCNFDSGDCSLLHPIDSVSIWEIGIPQKPYLDEAYSFPNALITDDSFPYPTNRRDFAQFDFPVAEYENSYFELWHKHEFDSLKDGGFIALATDSSGYYNLAYLYSSPNPIFIEGGMYTEGYSYDGYNVDDHFGVDTGYTGNSGNWQFTRVLLTWRFGVSPGKISGLPFPDTVHVRFYMVSDSIESGEDGWAIDNFLYGSFPVGGDIQNSNAKQINIYPNPVTENIYFFNQDIAGKIFDVKIIDMQGNLIKLIKHLHSTDGNGKADISEIPAGQYLIEIITTDEIYFSPFIRQ
ncbi:MAG: T9SS type A sorting domain-containing protein [Chitinophagales bacterium]